MLQGLYIPHLSRAALPVLGRGQGEPGGWAIFWLSMLGCLLVFWGCGAVL